MSDTFPEGTALGERGEWPWPDSLDALLAAPRHHTLLLENDRVRVLETRIPAGQLVPVHTHPWPSVLYVELKQVPP
jgi:quercetin dioxygenase-like cupin family protein